MKRHVARQRNRGVVPCGERGACFAQRSRTVVRKRGADDRSLVCVVGGREIRNLDVAGVVHVMVVRHDRVVRFSVVLAPEIVSVGIVESAGLCPACERRAVRKAHVVSDFVGKSVFAIDGPYRAARVAPCAVGKPSVVCRTVRDVAYSGGTPVLSGVYHQRNEIRAACGAARLDGAVRSVAGFRAFLDDTEDILIYDVICRIDRHDIYESVPEIRMKTGVRQNSVHLRDLRDGEIGDAAVVRLLAFDPCAGAVVEDEHDIYADRSAVGRDHVVVVRIAGDGKQLLRHGGGLCARFHGIRRRFDLYAASARRIRQINLFDLDL